MGVSRYCSERERAYVCSRIWQPESQGLPRVEMGDAELRAEEDVEAKNGNGTPADAIEGGGQEEEEGIVL